jgi:metal-dependent amidase/aminoacylase/carboxypeptidase family protein
VLTVGSVQAGTKSNVIPDSAQLQLNLRTYSDTTRSTMLDAIGRIVTAQCHASGSPRDPEFELFERFSLTDNDPATTKRVATAFVDFFADRAGVIPQQSASEDFSDIPNALGVPSRTGASVGLTLTPTIAPSRRAGLPKTSRSTIPPPSHQFFNPLWTRGPGH